jgi:hypothetical protein
LTNGTFIDLEFDTGNRGAPLGDIAASLVTLHDLLRDLGAMTAYPGNVEFRDIQVVAIETTRPLTITLSLVGISPAAVRAFQDICRDIIRLRQQPRSAAPSAGAREGVDHQRLGTIAGGVGNITETETRRLNEHIVALQSAEVPLKRVVVKNTGPPEEP